MTNTYNGNGNWKWLAGGIAAAVILSVSASWAIAGAAKADADIHEKQIQQDIRIIRADVIEVKESLARIEGRLDIN